MALRKYRKRTGSMANASAAAPVSTAASVTPEDHPPPETKPLPEPKPAPVAPEDNRTPHETSDAYSLKAQLGQLRSHAQQQQSEAERLKAQASIPLQQQIDQMPDLSLAQRAWPRQRPHALSRPDILGPWHQTALHSGIAPASPQYFQYLDSALHQLGNLAFHSPPPVAAQADNPPAQRAQPMPESDEPDYN